ncbi:MAG: hypothetical protein JNJ77_14500 [Planctomycetia bacterium]|nr:hypothetical protein [Planctomycetia bacterium]
MSTQHLAKTIESLLDKIRKYQDRRTRLGEQNTKASLITPMIQALGWDTSDPDEVCHEYRTKSIDSPVDYALCISKPILLIEAKGLGEALDDRKWIVQVLSYATVAGVEWCLLTDGDEYRIYNSAAAVNADEKLFYKIKLTQTSIQESMSVLSLISKRELAGNNLREYWQSQVVDRRVRECLRSMVSKPSTMLVQLLKTQIKDLSANDIKQSLMRLDPRFESPIIPQRANTETRKHKASKLKLVKPLERASSTVSLEELINAGIIPAPIRLFRKYKGSKVEAQLLRDGTIECNGSVFRSCSTAASEARSKVVGKHLATNGWEFWQLMLDDKTTVTLDDCREQYSKQHRRRHA